MVWRLAKLPRRAVAAALGLGLAAAFAWATGGLAETEPPSAVRLRTGDSVDQVRYLSRVTRARVINDAATPLLYVTIRVTNQTDRSQVASQYATGVAVMAGGTSLTLDESKSSGAQIEPRLPAEVHLFWKLTPGSPPPGLVSVRFREWIQLDRITRGEKPWESGPKARVIAEVPVKVTA